MRASRTSAWAYGFCGLIYGAAALLTVVVAAVLKVEVAWWEEKLPSILPVIKYLRNSAPVLLLSGTVLAGAGKLLRSTLGSPRTWALIQAVLERMRALAFSDVPGDEPVHYHRVTLFKAVRFRHFPAIPWHCQRWLVPYERSGHTTRKSRSAFRIPDDADNVEGIAGQTWATRNGLVVAQLPAIEASTEAQTRQHYARLTHMSEERVDGWLRDRRSLARSFCGIPVEVGGKLWGVLVFDSRQEQPIAGLEVYEGLARILGALLERG